MMPFIDDPPLLPKKVFYCFHDFLCFPTRRVLYNEHVDLHMPVRRYPHESLEQNASDLEGPSAELALRLPLF